MGAPVAAAVAQPVRRPSVAIGIVRAVVVKWVNLKIPALPTRPCSAWAPGRLMPCHIARVTRASTENINDYFRTPCHLRMRRSDEKHPQRQDDNANDESGDPDNSPVDASSVIERRSRGRPPLVHGQIQDRLQ